jgi:hypothetical protein
MPVIYVNDGVFKLSGTANQIALSGSGFNALAGGTDITLSLASPLIVGSMSPSAPAITPGSGAGVTVNNVGELRELVYKVTTTFNAYSAAAKTGDVTICTLPTKTQVTAIFADTTVAYTGGGESAATLKVGLTAGAAEIVAVHDVFSGAVTKGLADADMGSGLTRAAAIQGSYPGSFSGVTTLVARLTTTTNNTSTLTTGSTTFYVVARQLP